ncbi:MAG TPA: MazG family protein, partial [Thermomicrobiales bacterium]|nr:MazG family protein [Thermomicrobiales bacterium]
DAFREELGDVLLQVYLQSQMAEEAGEFTLEEVYDAIATKLVRRHPHVFGDVIATDSGQVLRNWDQIKETERRAKGRRAEKAAPSALDGIPRSMPALARAALTQDRIDRLAADHRAAADFRAALDQAVATLNTGADHDTLGAALFALAGLARLAGLDPEEALNAAITRLATRFKALETTVRATGRDWHNLTPVEIAGLWEECANLDSK